MKRFIAGATCPQCKMVDKTVIVKENDHEHTECVRCGYRMEKPLPPTGEKKLKTIRIISKKSRGKNDGKERS